MHARFDDRLCAYFMKPGKRSYLQTKLEAGAYDRFFDNFNVLEKSHLYDISEKIRHLINAFYEKAFEKLDGFSSLSKLNFIEYNEQISHISAYQHFEAALEKFIEKEVLRSGSDCWLKIQALALELIHNGRDVLLDEKGDVRLGILDSLRVTDSKHREALHKTDGARKVVKSYAAEAVRQVGQYLRQQKQNSKARVTACGVHAFTAIERGLQQAISRNIRFIGLTDEEAQLAVSQEEKSDDYSDSSFSPCSAHRLFKSAESHPQPESNFAENIMQFGKKLFGLN